MDWTIPHYKSSASKLHLFPGKHKSNLIGPFLITEVFPHGAIEVENKEGAKFTVNGQRIRTYLGQPESVHKVLEAYNLYEV